MTKKCMLLIVISAPLAVIIGTIIFITYSPLMYVERTPKPVVLKNNQAKVEIWRNGSVGDNWEYTISPEGIIFEADYRYYPDAPDDGISAGSGGTGVYVFEAITGGEAEIVFGNYWRGAEEPIETLVYKAAVDSAGKLSITPIPKDSSNETPPDYSITGCWILYNVDTHIHEVVLNSNGRYYEVCRDINDIDFMYETMISIDEGTYSIDAGTITFTPDYKLNLYYDGDEIADLRSISRLSVNPRSPNDANTRELDDNENVLFVLNSHGVRTIYEPSEPMQWWSFEHRAFFEN